MESLLSQGMASDEYEIITVDDGSTDGGNLIARKFVNEHSNIRLIIQNNKGAGGARNTGMRQAKGRYILFVDADDFLSFNILKPLLDKMDFENLDILRFNYQHVNENYEIIRPYKNDDRFMDYRDEVTHGLAFLIKRMSYACYVPQFIFRTDLIVREENFFKENIYFEDTEWTPRILVQANRITSVGTVVFNYLLNAGSITQENNLEKKRKILDDKLHIIDFMNLQMECLKDKKWHKGMIAFTVLTALDDVLTYFSNEYPVFIRKLKRKEVFPLFSYRLNRNKRMSLILLNISPDLYCIVRHRFLSAKNLLPNP